MVTNTSIEANTGCRFVVGTNDEDGTDDDKAVLGDQYRATKYA